MSVVVDEHVPPFGWTMTTSGGQPVCAPAGIDLLAAALARAQGQITGALKDSSNPFYKSKYADLASVWDACRDALSSNGLAVIQTTEPGRMFRGTITTQFHKEDKTKITDLEMSEIVVVTTLVHSSGQLISGRLHMTPIEPTPQAVGSCITYARRYALAAIVGVAQVDDDGNAASKWAAKDTRDVHRYKQLIVKASDNDDDAELRRLWKEVSGDEEFCSALWSLLSKPHQARWDLARKAAP